MSDPLSYLSLVDHDAEIAQAVVSKAIERDRDRARVWAQEIVNALARALKK